MKTFDELPDRIKNKIAIRESGCWEWTGGKTHGNYGVVCVDRRTQRAHRITYQLLVGRIPTGMQLDHLCRNHPCVNPSHLEPVVCRENIRRGESHIAENMRKTHCPSGHAYTPENTWVSKLGYRYCRECKRNRDYQRSRAMGRRIYQRHS